MRVQISGAAEGVQRAMEALLREYPDAQQASPPADQDTRSDPLAVVALIVAIPSAVESIVNLVDRRRKAREERASREQTLAQLRASNPGIEVVVLDDPGEAQ